jgi:hypothetical protein
MIVSWVALGLGFASSLVILVGPNGLDVTSRTLRVALPSPNSTR